MLKSAVFEAKQPLEMGPDLQKCKKKKKKTPLKWLKVSDLGPTPCQKII